jgi:hypothetical protein
LYFSYQDSDLTAATSHHTIAPKYVLFLIESSPMKTDTLIQKEHIDRRSKTPLQIQM